MKKPYKTYAGAHPSIQINVLRYLPTDRFVEALKRIRSHIAGGAQLTAYDDDSPGNKSSECSWGLCNTDPLIWPDAQDHTFPVDFDRHLRSSPLDAKLRCPLDRRPGPQIEDDGPASGCFYTCSVFQSSRSNPVPTREQALAKYDDYIKRSK